MFIVEEKYQKNANETKTGENFRIFAKYIGPLNLKTTLLLGVRMLND